MAKWIWLIVGGSCGTVGRYVVSGAMHRIGADFPYGTLTVNMIGCVCIGFVATMMESKMALSEEVQLFLMVGLLGAFTTFSTLIYDSWRLAQHGQVWLAGINMCGSMLLGICALWCGAAMASWM